MGFKTSRVPTPQGPHTSTSCPVYAAGWRRYAERPTIPRRPWSPSSHFPGAVTSQPEAPPSPGSDRDTTQCFWTKDGLKARLPAPHPSLAWGVCWEILCGLVSPSIHQWKRVTMAAPARTRRHESGYLRPGPGPTPCSRPRSLWDEKASPWDLPTRRSTLCCVSLRLPSSGARWDPQAWGGRGQPGVRFAGRRPAAPPLLFSGAQCVLCLSGWGQACCPGLCLRGASGDGGRWDFTHVDQPARPTGGGTGEAQTTRVGAACGKRFPEK